MRSSLIVAITSALLLAACDCGGTKQVAAHGELKVAENQVDFGAACPLPSDPSLKVETKTGSVHVSNGGAAVLEINQFEVDASKKDQFVLDASKIPTEIGVGEAVEVPITFTPKAGGTVVADLSIKGDDPDQPATVVKLLGEGKNAPSVPTLGMTCPGGKFYDPSRPESDSCAAMNPNVFFPDTLKNSLGEMTVTLANTGCPLMNVSNIKVTTNTENGEDPNTFVLAEGQETSFGVVNGVEGKPIKLRFAPKDSNSFKGTLSFETNDPAHKTVSLELRGAGLEPAIDVGCIGCQNPILCDFAPLTGFCSGKFTIHNSGTHDLDISAVHLKDNNPNFKITKQPAAGTKIPAGQDLIDGIEVQYVPQVKKGSDLLLVDSNAGTASAELRGGSPPVLSVDTGEVDTNGMPLEGIVNFGDGLDNTTTLKRTVKLTNKETYNQQLPLSVSQIVISTVPPSNQLMTFSIPAAEDMATGKSVPVNGSVQFDVQYKPGGNGGTSVGDLFVKTNDPAFSPPGAANGYIINLAASSQCNPKPVPLVSVPSMTACTTSCANGDVCVDGFCHTAGSSYSTTLVSLGSNKTIPVSGAMSYDLTPDTQKNCTVQDRTKVQQWEWSLTTKPPGSMATISPTGIGAQSQTTLTVDKTGPYQIRLYVYDDTKLKGGPVTYTINVQ